MFEFEYNNITKKNCIVIKNRVDAWVPLFFQTEMIFGSRAQIEIFSLDTLPINTFRKIPEPRIFYKKLTINLIKSTSLIYFPVSSSKNIPMKKFLEKYPFKDLKTKERIRNEVSEPDFELSQKEDIDACFEYFCNTFRQKEIDDNFDIQKSNKLEGLEKGFKRKDKKMNTMLSLPDLELKYSAEESKRHKKSGNLDFDETFGNEDMDSPILIDKTISNHLKKNVSKETYGPAISALLDENTMRLFDINGSFPKNVVNEEQRNSYLLKLMFKNIDKMLDKWSSRRTNYKHEDEEFEKEKQNINRKYQEVKDNFAWLRIDTKYESLLKKLRAALLEKLNEFDNQNLVTDALDERSRLQTQTSNNTSTIRTLNSSRISLLNIPSVTTKQLLETTESNRSYLGVSLTSKGKKSTNSLKPTRPLTAASSSLNKFNSTASTTEAEEKEFFKALFYDFDFNKDSRKLEDHEVLERQNFERNLKWNITKEETFQKRRDEAKNQYTLEITSSNWNELGILDLVEKANMEYKRNHNRLNTLNKFANRDEITIDELKFLADTSELLNSCLDKKFIQEAVDILDPELISNLELYLAERVLRSYHTMREKVVQERIEFLEDKNKKVYERVKNYSRKMKIKFDREKNKKSHLKFLIRINKLIDKMNKEGKFASDKKLAAQMFISNIKKAVEKKYGKSIGNEKQAGFLERNRHKDAREELEETKKRRFHPSSKLMKRFKADLDSELTLASKKRMADNKKLENDYRLFFKTPKVNKVPTNFKKFYSGGPRSGARWESFMPTGGDPKKITVSPAELKKIIKIQALARRYIARCKITVLKDNKKFEKIERLSKFIRQKHRDFNFNSGPSSLFQAATTATISRKPLPDNKVEPSSGKKLTLMTRIKTMTDSALGVKKPKETTKLTQKEIAEEKAKKRLEEIEKRDLKIGKLFVKHEKLLYAAQKNMLYLALNSGFSYSKKDIDCRDKEGNTPLYYVAQSGNYEFCKFLIENGANVNEKCMAGDTPSHMAFKTNKFDFVLFFLVCGADLNTLNDKGETPLAFGTVDLLKKLDLTNGVTMTSNRRLSVNNNQLLKKKYREDLFDPAIKFQFERLKKNQTKILKASKDGSYRVSSFMGSIDSKDPEIELGSAHKLYPEEIVRGSKKKLTFHSQVEN